MAAPEKREYQMVMHQVKPAEQSPEWEGYSMPAKSRSKTSILRSISASSSVRSSTEYIREDEDLLRITRYFFEKNAPIASVCHGVEIPARADCVRGRRMATVPKCKFDLEVCGGIFVDEPCVVDGNLVSGRTFWDHGHYMGEWVKLLNQACNEE